MKIAVLIKQVPDTETKAQLNEQGLDESGIKFILNPYDEFAVEESIKLKGSDEVTVISLGPERSKEAIRTALAMGCDNAIQIKVSDEDNKRLDPFLTAKALAKVVEKKGGFDLILCGKQAIDDDSLAVPQMVAEFLGWGRATVVQGVSVDGSTITAKRAVDGGKVETLMLQTPALLSATKGLNNPRYASLPGIMKAKKKPIEEISLGDLSLSVEDSKVEAISFENPPEKSAGKILQGDAKQLAQEIVQHLRNDAKVI